MHFFRVTFRGEAGFNRDAHVILPIAASWCTPCYEARLSDSGAVRYSWSVATACDSGFTMNAWRIPIKDWITPTALSSMLYVFFTEIGKKGSSSVEITRKIFKKAAALIKKEKKHCLYLIA